MTGQADTARDLRLKLRHAEDLSRAATQACEEAGTLLETTLQDGLQTGLECDIEATEHRREHRPGRAPRIDTDPALEAFIRSRLDKLTFAEIAAASLPISRPNAASANPQFTPGGSGPVMNRDQRQATLAPRVRASIPEPPDHPG